MVTDGVTEADVSRRREFGDERVCETLRGCRAARVRPTSLVGLVAAVDEWAGGAGVSDDLTALILKAR